MRAMQKLSLPQLQVPGMEGHAELAAVTPLRDKLWSPNLQSLSCGTWIQPCFQIARTVQNQSLPRRCDNDEAEIFDFHIQNAA